MAEPDYGSLRGARFVLGVGMNDNVSASNFRRALHDTLSIRIGFTTVPRQNCKKNLTQAYDKCTAGESKVRHNKFLPECFDTDATSTTASNRVADVSSPNSLALTIRSMAVQTEITGVGCLMIF